MIARYLMRHDVHERHSRVIFKYMEVSLLINAVTITTTINIDKLVCYAVS